MIIQAPAARLTYSTDVVANSLRSVVAAPAMRLGSRRDDAPAAPLMSAMDLNALYPAIFAKQRSQTPLPIRAIRGLAFRLSVLGSTAAMLVVLHHI